MADKSRSSDQPVEAAEDQPTSDVRPRRVEFYAVDGKHGYRRVAATGEVVQELPAEHDTLADAVAAAKDDSSNEGLTIVT